METDSKIVVLKLRPELLARFEQQQAKSITSTSKTPPKKRDSRAVSGDIASNPFTLLLTRDGDERLHKKAKIDTSNLNIRPPERRLRMWPPEKYIGEKYEIDLLFDKINWVDNRSTGMLEKNKELVKEVAALKTEKEALQALGAENVKLTEQAASLARDKAAMQHEIRGLKGQVDNLEREVKKSGKALRDYKKRVRALGSEF